MTKTNCSHINYNFIYYFTLQLSDAEYYSNGKITLLEDRRLGQLKWFSENVNPALFGKLNERIECITDYSTKTAEGYQTVNYGLGGHFSVHVDAFTDVRDFLLHAYLGSLYLITINN